MAKRVVETPEEQPPEQGRQAVAVRSGGAAAQDNVRNAGLIIRREYRSRVTQRSFIISTIILLALIVIGAFVPTIIQLIARATSGQAQSQTHIVVVNQAGAVAGLDEAALASLINSSLNGTQTGSSAPYAISSQSGASVADLQQQVKDGKLDILLLLSRSSDQRLQLTYVTETSEANDGDLPAIQTLALQLTFLDTAHQLGLTPDQVRSLSAPPDLTITRLVSESSRPTNQLIVGFVLTFVAAYLLFYSVITYATAVANGVVEEKSSRVMELLLNAATPWQLLVGKIVGIGAAGLTQMVCLVVVGIGALLLQIPLQAALFGVDVGGFSQYLSAVSIPFLLLFLVYFLLAYFLYSSLFAGLGALVRRQDEVQSVIQIPLFLMIASVALLYLAAFAPDTTLTRVLSFVPFFTPTMMLARLGLGTVAWWEVVVTILLMGASIAACAWVAARLYRYGVLMYGQKPGLRQLARIIRAK
ncbi:MAG TPA: ABC transporter permease [Ktedonobacterales bacterium]|jgi:ABC-2 type transport system permease protein|nr:ABC transporter permease [Ktedonobacterales bacterium]